MIEAPKLKAPFPAFGGKSRVAALVWGRLGDVSNYIEPFANSAAVLLARPTPPRIETINDLNGYVANFWRAVRADPEAVAHHADWPVNEADLHARHRWLVLSAESAEFRGRMKVDPDYFDPKIAGWWVWGACCWIGSGWCEVLSEQLPCLTTAFGKGVNSGNLSAKLPDISGHAGASGRGILASGPHQKRPQIKEGSGAGVLASGPREGRPQLADAFARGRGVHGHDQAETCEARRLWLVDWMGRLSDRLRTVRVCCGDWLRVCDSFSVTTRLGMTGVFLDAPYKTHLADGTANRSGDLYSNDRDQDVNKLVDGVIAYCAERGSDPLMRIAACCYEGEGYEVLGPLGWGCVPWKAHGGYGNRAGKPNDNAGRERIWFSPGCLDPGRGRAEQRGLFGIDTGGETDG
jgi:DNA adenine methylase